MTAREVNTHRERAFSTVTTEIGVYGLCDLDGTVIYIGQTTSTGERGIRGRSRRHVTSARSDTIANRQIDVWEIAYLWAWPEPDERRISALEANLYNFFDRQSPLLNGRVIPALSGFERFTPPPHTVTQLLPDEEIQRRRDPRNRLPRQVQHMAQLLDWIVNIKDAADLRRTLSAHFARVQKHYETFTCEQRPELEAAGE